MIFDSLSVIIPLIIIILLLVSMIKILREYERGVIFMLGRFWGVKGPGLIIVIPGLQQMLRVDLRTMVLDVPTQDVISRDNVSVKVNAVIYFRVVDPELAIIQVEDYYEATSQLAQTTLRSVLGQHELDDMLAEREKLSTNIQTILDNQTDGWGIKVTHVEMKQVDLNDSMVRAIAKQANERMAFQAGCGTDHNRKDFGRCSASEQACVLSGAAMRSATFLVNEFAGLSGGILSHGRALVEHQHGDEGENSHLDELGHWTPYLLG